jgi:hypothetical protein
MNLNPGKNEVVPKYGSWYRQHIRSAGLTFFNPAERIKWPKG